MTELLAYLYAETPVRAGAAGPDGPVDLPVQREATTGYPVIWAQSLKGALRRAARDSGWDDAALRRVFGSDIGRLGDGDGGSVPGALAVADAHLVALPVPTLRRTFAWVTSQVALARLARKYTSARRDVPPVPAPEPGAATAASAGWTQPPGQTLGPLVVPVRPEPDAALAAWAALIATDAVGDAPGSAEFAGKLREDLIAAGSDVMPALCAECTEITTRIQLGEDKTVHSGPFYSEYLPAETIMAASFTLRPRGRQPAQADASMLASLLHGRVLQVGGDETLGKGLMWARVVTEAT